jgi:hypothetical protein
MSFCCYTICFHLIISFSLFHSLLFESPLILSLCHYLNMLEKTNQRAFFPNQFRFLISYNALYLWGQMRCLLDSLAWEIRWCISINVPWNISTLLYQVPKALLRSSYYIAVPLISLLSVCSPTVVSWIIGDWPDY